MASAPINPSRFNQLEIEEFLSRADRFVGEHRESSPKSAAGKTFRQLSRYLWVSEQVLRPGRPFNELFSVLSGNRKALLRGALGLEKNAQSMWLDSQADAFSSKSSLRAVYVARSGEEAI